MLLQIIFILEIIFLFTQVAFLSHSQEVTVDSVEDVKDHVHEVDPDFAKNPSKNMRWPDEATAIVLECVQNRQLPAAVMKKLKNSNVFAGKMPSMTQVYNKIAASKAIAFPSKSVNNTHELRDKVSEYLDQPVSDIEAFVAHQEIDDEDETKEPRFTIIFSSKKNMKKMKSDRVLQTDATYRLNWLGFLSQFLV